MSKMIKTLLESRKTLGNVQTARMLVAHLLMKWAIKVHHTMFLNIANVVLTAEARRQGYDLKHIRIDTGEECDCPECRAARGEVAASDPTVH